MAGCRERRLNRALYLVNAATARNPTKMLYLPTRAHVIPCPELSTHEMREAWITEGWPGRSRAGCPLDVLAVNCPVEHVAEEIDDPVDARGGLLDVLAESVSHVEHGLSTHPDVPLAVRARYSRLEILAAFGIGDRAKVAPWQTGVYWAREVKADLFAFTLDKTSGQFSPTTRYRDYAISRELIHWESQSATRTDSETGRRYHSQAISLRSSLPRSHRRPEDRATSTLRVLQC